MHHQPTERTGGSRVDRGRRLMHDGCVSPPEDPINASSALGAARPRAGAHSRLGLLGTAAQMFFGWGFTFGFAIFASLVSILTFGRLSNTLTPALLRFWARVMLFIQRVELVVEGSEYITPRTMKVSLFNHTSLLDAMLVTAVMPTGAVAAIKREALYIPFVGLALWSLGFLLIDRGRTERAKTVLARAAARMERERLTVFIAPEGTRGRHGELRAFKKGAFHIARVSGAPVVPMLIDGAHDVHPLGSPVSHPGLIRVRFLPPVPTTGLTIEGMDAFVARIHAYMAEGLEDMRRVDG